MCRNDLANAPDKVAIGCEPATGKQCLKLSHKLVELADQVRNSINGMKRIGHARRDLSDDAELPQSPVARQGRPDELANAMLARRPDAGSTPLRHSDPSKESHAVGSEFAAIFPWRHLHKRIAYNDRNQQSINLRRDVDDVTG